MAKTKSVFFCQSCGVQSPKWLGKCPSCGEWNTYVEEVVSKSSSSGSASIKMTSTSPKATLLNKIEFDKGERIISGFQEFDRVLGGGLVPGSVILMGGEPGIGKSTLLLQIALHISNLKVLYITGEESAQQIKMRSDRIGHGNNQTYILTETNTQNIFLQIEELHPELIIIDSIQTIHTTRIESSPGSISQIRESAAELQNIAKSLGIPIVLIGHITKDGYIAGPKVLEHMVDTVLQLEGDRNHAYRILRALKNRFGSTAEIGLFEMLQNGLREVSNPSELLLSNHDKELSGIAVASTIEGIRPMLIEIQSLVSSAVYGTPQRSTTGFDIKRLNMLLAVLEKRCGFRLSSKDVFLNIAGGLKVNDPAIDLAVVGAILSSSEDMSISMKYCFAGEVGLSGEIRPVNRIEHRIAEADKLGFEKIFISSYNSKGIPKTKSVEIIKISTIEQMFTILFG